MSRLYVVQNWSDSSSYSGEMVQDRLADSKELHILPNGKANIRKYSDKLSVKNPIKQKHIREQIIPQLSTLNKLDEQEKLLEDEFSNGSLTFQEYNELSTALEKKRHRAFKAYERAIERREVVPSGVGEDHRFEGVKPQQYSLIGSMLKSSATQVSTHTEENIKKEVVFDDIFFLLSSMLVTIVMLVLSN